MASNKETTQVESFVEFLRTCRARPGLFTPDAQAKIHVPGGHYVVSTPEGLEQELSRFTKSGYTVDVGNVETLPQGFIIEFTQRTPTGELFEEMVWARLEGGQVREMRWYCTGVVHEHPPELAPKV